ncbi:MAG TPA: L,D-transpeptidase family protein [Solirubrobacteraceae bacterium]|jgi:lipoprotein-anchoring transpeptidase ErfK/SrfK|nr:L,D-transpeptidase family protein [Solirubrobacteraceae bacterium]
MRRTALLGSIAVLAAAPSVAHPQQPAPVAPAVAPAPVQTQMTLGIDGVGGKLATVLVGDRIRIRGTVGAFVPGEVVTLRLYSSGVKLSARRLEILPGPDGTGIFELAYRAQRSGQLVVGASHAPTPALETLAATGSEVDVIPRSVGTDGSKPAIKALQRRLKRLGYVVGHRGSFDARTARAVLAFRKVTGMRRTSEASKPLMRAIARGKGAFVIRRPEHGRHIEADLTRQVIALIEGGKVRRIYPISSGKPGTPTVLGAFRVYLKSYGTNAKGMVHAAYFIGGYATHGYYSVPTYPASHGCLRVPIADALNLFHWIRVGTPVDVYYGPQPR